MTASSKTPKASFSERAQRALRTTYVRLFISYLLIFVFISGISLGYVGWTTRRIFDTQITETISVEVNVLAERYQEGGMRRLVSAIERRGRQTGSFLYLLIDPRGDSIAGNAILQLSLLEQSPGWLEARFQWPDDGGDIQRLAKLRVFILPSGSRLFVGRDLEERSRLMAAIWRTRGLSLVFVLLLGGLGTIWVARRILSRMNAIAHTSEAIMAGNLSERLPISDMKDEFDRLASHLNQMLDRIGELMVGLRELSDNVAHDLRTPLTRLRVSAEDALATASTPEQYRAALQRSIDESDKLIKVFDALLMIAQAESGQLSANLDIVRLDDIARDFAELYEPVAEEAGFKLVLSAMEEISCKANRALIGQALANLIENALKYGKSAAGEQSEIIIGLEVSEGEARLYVADRGQGIPESLRERVVERFSRLDRSRSAPGFGLGLSLVSAIARQQGGKFILENHQPGLKAVLVLPLAARDSSQHGQH